MEGEIIEFNNDIEKPICHCDEIFILMKKDTIAELKDFKSYCIK